MPKIKNGEEAFQMKLEALYDIENELVKALPQMEKAAKNPELKEGFRAHLEETRGHILRLEEAFKILEVKPKKLKVDGIRGIISDGKWVIDCDAPAATKDIMLAGAARYAEHYEMAGYLTAIEEAKACGQEEITDILSETLDEEEVADEKLSAFITDNLDAVNELAGKDDDEDEDEV